MWPLRKILQVGELVVALAVVLSVIFVGIEDVDCGRGLIGDPGTWEPPSVTIA